MQATDLDLLVDAARRSGEIAAGYFGQGPTVWDKPDDAGPVTEADLAVNVMLKETLGRARKDYGWLSEETEDDTTRLTQDTIFVVDPIDGTRAFISGIPVWGTLIGLYYLNRPLAGMMCQPFTGERYWSVSDEEHSDTAMRIHQGPKVELQTRKHDTLSLCTLMTTSPSIFPELERPRFDRLETCVQLSRYGCDCYAYCLLAAGHVDVVVESGLSIYDIAALIPIVEGAGGSVTNWQGKDASQGGQILAAANNTIRDQAIDILNA